MNEIDIMKIALKYTYSDDGTAVIYGMQNIIAFAEEVIKEKDDE